MARRLALPVATGSSGDDAGFSPEHPPSATLVQCLAVINGSRCRDFASWSTSADISARSTSPPGSTVEPTALRIVPDVGKPLQFHPIEVAVQPPSGCELIVRQGIAIQNEHRLSRLALRHTASEIRMVGTVHPK